MKLYTFDSLKVLGMRGVVALKPETMLARVKELKEADWILFPEYWQVNTLHYVLGCRLFPSVATYHLGHDKVEQTRALQALAPANIPKTLILPSNETSLERIMDEFSFPLVAKDIRSSRGEGVSLLTRRSELVAHAAERETLYIQERLPIDRDLRIVWVGDEIVGAYWRIAREGEFHNNVSRGGDVSYGPVPAVALDLVTEVARKLGIDHAGFDVAMVDGHPYIFEFNVRFGNKALLVTQAELATRIHTYLSRRSETKPPRAAVL